MSKRALLPFLTIFLWVSHSRAQSSSYLADLNALKSTIQKTPSYKAQIRGKKSDFYNALYGRLAADTPSKVTDYKYFYNLAQLIFPLKDNHLAFYQIPNYEYFKDKESIAKYLTTKEFSDYPKSDINIDSLRPALAKKPAESIEGIYYYDQFYSVGLFKSGDKEYTGVVVDTDTALWQNGQIAIHLYEYEPKLYKAIYGHPKTKQFLLQAAEKYKNQSLVNSYFYNSYSQNVYSKQLLQNDFVNLPKNASKFELKHVTSDIQYLLTQTFQVNHTSLQQSNDFYDLIKDSLTAPNLILDLRNNEGGARKASKKYFQLIKQYAKKGNVFILLNNETLSRAEIFTLQLKKHKNITTLGQTTKGMLTYGSNYGKREKLPSQRLAIYLTDMKGSAKHLRYEDYGIEPDIVLNNNSNWIDQAVEIIRRK